MSESLLDWRISSEASPVKKPARRKFPSQRVMIVDDDQDTRQLLCTLLEIEGMEVVGMVEDGMHSVDIAMECQPDVIILDYMMPNLNGEETAKFLRAVAPNSKIIAFSGAAIDAPDWADAFLPKGGTYQIVRLIASLNAETGP